jgi:uncharacterized protein YndB with AHSA1/START domain
MTSLTLVRLIRARPAIVFEAMTTADGISHWWGPDSGPVLHAQSDPRPGGSFRVRFRSHDGVEHESSGQFLEVTPPTKVVMSWRWTGGREDPGESRLEITLRPVPEGTEVTFTHALLHDEASRRDHEAGWIGSFAKLDAYLSKEAPRAGPG